MEMSLEEVFEFIRNGASIKQFNGSGVPITRIETIATGNIDLDKVGYADIFDSKYESYYLKDGDILMSHINSLKHLGKVAIVESLEDNVIHGMNLLCLRPKKMVCPKFLLNYFRTQQFNAEILRISKKSVNQASFNITDLKKIKINLPNLEIQNKIADTLDLSSDLIEKRKEQIAEMDKLIQSVYCQINKNETFDTMKVSDVVEKISTGKSYYSEEISTFKVLKTSAVSYGYFDDSQYKNLPREYDPPESTFVKKGDVLVSRMNTEELVGASAYVWKDSDFLTLPDRLWKLHVMENVDPIYLWKTLQQSYFRDSIRRNASGTSGSMKNISQKQFMSLKINIPNILIQKKFASIVEEIEAQKKLMEESLHEMENNFSALMKKAFRGELFPEE
ncbi:restriction endonuclease subunit S [Enterococcus faecalis]|nr:restriction endonuclease subunit S [Enterococcus faecalis]MDB1590422.1 restriction endonuclease subunit S [Enterococcus faecalis]